LAKTHSIFPPFPAILRESQGLELTISPLRVPERVQRPTAAREALRLSPLVQAGWADASRIEGIPLIAAGAEPFVFFAGRPTAERAADARAGWIEAYLLLKLAVWNADWVVRHRTHARYYDVARP
jgi:hypothetical protein